MKKLREIFGGIFTKKTEPSPITEPFTIISGRTAAEICRDFEFLKEQAKTHLGGQPAPHEFVNRLVRDKLYADATRFLAYGLPKRQATWWACLCVRSVPACYGDQISDEALQTAEAWVKQPTDENQQAALAAGNKHKFEMPTAPAAWTAMAAGFSAGTNQTSEQSKDVPSEQLTAHAASGAILLAATVQPDRADQMYHGFLETGVLIAQGKKQISP